MVFDSDIFIEQFWRAFNSRDPEQIAALLTDDIVLEVSFGTEPCGARVIGRRAVHRFYTEMYSRIPDSRYVELRRIVCLPHIVLESVHTGTPSGGKMFETHICDVLTLRSERIEAKRSYRKAQPIQGMDPENGARSG